MQQEKPVPPHYPTNHVPSPEDSRSPSSSYYNVPPHYHVPSASYQPPSSSALTLPLNTDVQRSSPPPIMDHLPYAHQVRSAAQTTHDVTIHATVKMEPVEYHLLQSLYSMPSPATTSTTATPDDQIYTHVAMLPHAPGALHAEGGSHSTFRMSELTISESPSTYTPRFVNPETQLSTYRGGQSAAFAIDLTGSVTCDDGHGCGTAPTKKVTAYLSDFRTFY